MTRKRNHRMRQTGANNCYVSNLVFNLATPSAEEVTGLMNEIRAAYQRVRDGVGSSEDVGKLGVVANIGSTRGKTIGQLVVNVFDRAGAALVECDRRVDTHGRYGFDGPGILAMNAAMDLYADLLAMSTRKQMNDIEKEVRLWMRAHPRQEQAA